MFEEMEFDCGHFGVFENAIDMAHIHYLHGDSFGNEVRGLGVWVCGERGWGNVGALAGGWWGWLAASFDSTSWLSSHANVLHCRASAPICWLRPACLLSPQGKPEIRDMQATSDAHSVTATFQPVYTLTVTKQGTGSGTVTSIPVTDTTINGI